MCGFLGWCDLEERKFCSSRCVRVLGYEGGKVFKTLSAPYRLRLCTTNSPLCFKHCNASFRFTEYSMINGMFSNLQCFCSPTLQMFGSTTQFLSAVPSVN